MISEERKRTNRISTRRYGCRLLAAFLALCMMFTVFPVGFLYARAADNQTIVQENGKNVYQIRSFNDLQGAADYSRGNNWNTVQIYRLMNNIPIKENEMSQLGENHLTFGTREKPFCAELDGGGYTISGLSYAE